MKDKEQVNKDASFKTIWDIFVPYLTHIEKEKEKIKE